MANDTKHGIGHIAHGTVHSVTDPMAAAMPLLTNGSGGSVVTGDVLVQDITADEQFTTVASEADDRKVFVVPNAISGSTRDGSTEVATKTILSTEIGGVHASGYVPAAAVDGEVTWGEFLVTSSTAKKLTGTDKIQGTHQIPVGACAIALGDTAVAASIPIWLFDKTHVLPGSGSATDGQVLTADGSGGAAFETRGLLDLVVAETEVVNTTDWTAIYSKSIPANTLGSGNGVQLTLVGSLLNTSGAQRYTQYRVTYGSTIIAAAWQGEDAANSATRYGETLEVELWADGGTAAQEAFARSLSSGSVFGTQGGGAQAEQIGTATEDSTGALTLLVECSHEVAHASKSFITKLAVLELLQT
jgi:hypothetical protein